MGSIGWLIAGLALVPLVGIAAVATIYLALRKAAALTRSGTAPRCRGKTLRVLTLRVVRQVALRRMVRTAANGDEGSSRWGRRLKRLLEELETLRFGDEINKAGEMGDCDMRDGDIVEIDVEPTDEPVGFVDIIHRLTNCM